MQQDEVHGLCRVVLQLVWYGMVVQKFKPETLKIAKPDLDLKSLIV